MFKRAVVLRPKKITSCKWDYKTIILFTLFLCGVILGIFIIKNGSKEFCDFLSNLLRNYISTKSKSNILMCFSGLTLLVVVFLFIDFILGLCAVGTPLVWCVPTFFGVMSGCCVSVMFINYGLKGLLYCVMVDLIWYAITAATLVKCCCESTRMSVELFSCICKNNSLRNIFSFKEYVLNYLVLCVPVLIAAFISTILFKVFASLFVFV